MNRLLPEQELPLSRFGEFLLKQQFVKAGHERYLVFWVRKFLARPVEIPVRNLDDQGAEGSGIDGALPKSKNALGCATGALQTASFTIQKRL